LVPAHVNPNFNQEQLKVLKEDTVDYNQNISPTSNLNTNGANKASSILENSLNRGN
jgi:hypothetical protein